ncbi:MAG: hypothetical protein ACPGXK_03095 [Phycisphaerae bacterium]
MNMNRSIAENRMPVAATRRLRLVGGFVVLGLVTVGCLSGCESSGRRDGSRLRNSQTTGTYSVRRVMADARAAFAVAESVLIDDGYQLAVRDTQRRILRSIPMRTEASDRAAPRRARLGTRPPLRRTAEIFLDDDEGVLRLYCQVVLEELATEAYEFQSTDQRSSDLPGATPIDRGAGATREQRDVWRFVRRDRRRERDLLEQIIERTPSASPIDADAASPSEAGQPSE